MGQSIDVLLDYPELADEAMVKTKLDAEKGALITMKEMKSAYPVENVLNMIKKVLLK